MPVKCTTKSLNLRGDCITTIEFLCTLSDFAELFASFGVASIVFPTDGSKIKCIATSSDWYDIISTRHFSATMSTSAITLLDEIEDAEKSFAPVQLDIAMWHLPYVFQEFTSKGKQVFLDDFANEIDVKTAVKVSTSRCSKAGELIPVEKALQIYDKLFSGPKPHMSPTEHQAKVPPKYADFRTPGITHMDRNGNAWSGNLKNFVQYRQLIQTI